MAYVGGSAGHASIWGVDVQERICRDRSREYEFSVRSRLEIVEETHTKDASKSKAELKAARLEERMQRKATELIEQIYKGDLTKAMTQTDIEGQLGVSGTEIKRVLGIVIGDGRLKVVPKAIEKNSRKFDGYMLGASLGATAWRP